MVEIKVQDFDPAREREWRGGGGYYTICGMGET